MKSDAGNALFLILIAVVLFAALSYSGTQSSRGRGSIDSEQVRIDASQFFRYGQTLRSAIQRLQIINRCSATEISFDNDIDPTGRYTNSNEPIDMSCNVFAPQGGGVTVQKLDAKYQPAEGSNLYGRYHYATGSAIPHSLPQLGSEEQDIYLAVYYRTDQNNLEAFLALCKEINRASGVPENIANYENLPAINASTVNRFFGGIYVAAGDSPAGIGLHRYSAFCAQNSGTHLRIAMPILVR